MEPRPIDPATDFPALARLLGRTRLQGGIWHPGGIAWWLRDLVDERDDFHAFVWPAQNGDELDAFVMIDGSFVIAESDAGPGRRDLVDWSERRLREMGKTQIETSAVADSELQRELTERGFTQTNTSLELMTDTAREPEIAVLPDGFRFATLNEVDDEAYIEGHRAAWSDKRPSPYRRELHDAVTSKPQFRPDLVTIVLAPDGTVASYCIGWLDPQCRTLEIEPLGTHRDYRRQHLATAVVHEVSHRAWANGAQNVIVWNDPKNNERPYLLYTSAGMRPYRHIAELTKQL